MTDMDVTQVFGPATELGASWCETLRRRHGAATIAWSDATQIGSHLLEQLEARLRGGVVEPARYSEVWSGTPPEVDDVLVLRSHFRNRAVERLPPEQAVRVLAAAEEAVDELLAAVVRVKIDLLESAAFLDPLTGVGNRRGLQRDLGAELARAFRHGRPLAVAAIDLDGLKVINDTRGHAAGDDALRRLANALCDTLRVSDVVYRVGGDEFVVLMPETAAEDVKPLLVRAMASAPSFSFGVAAAPVDATTPDELLAFADAQLIENRRHRREEPALAETDHDPVVGWGELDGIGPEPEPEPVEVKNGFRNERIQIEEILAVTTERVFTVEVSMRYGDRLLTGRATGSAAAAAANRIVASAALAAAVSLDSDLDSTYIEGASLLRVGETDLAVVNVVFVGVVEETSTGAAQVRQRGVGDAVARAVLDALNRRLDMHSRYQPSLAPGAGE